MDVPPNNPDQKSMQKIGNGTITIEPHKFDVSFYTVREAQAPLPYYRHANQHTPKATGLPVTPGPAFTPPQPSTPAAAPTHQQPIPSQPSISTAKQESQPSTPANVPATPNPATAAASPTSRHIPKTTSDPVIQMLAARAATDSRLKELMKVVATSKASPEQLREFQRHIDEFNAVVKKQEAERIEKEKQQPKTESKPPPVAVSTSVASHPATYNAAARPAAPGAPSPLYASYPPPPRPEAIIKHIVIEFHGEGASPDRWLFPEYAVLDIKYGDVEMVTSFFVERKGSDIVSSLAGGSAEEAAALQTKWKADQEYYQPVTMAVRANHHRAIETIARAAKVLPEVLEHMKNVMKDKVRAPEEYLVHQLPREKGLATTEISSVDFVDSAVEMVSDEEDDELKDFYGTS